MSGKEIFFKDLDANTLDALKRYEQQFVYDEDPELLDPIVEV